MTELHWEFEKKSDVVNGVAFFIEDRKPYKEVELFDTFSLLSSNERLKVSICVCGKLYSILFIKPIILEYTSERAIKHKKFQIRTLTKKIREILVEENINWDEIRAYPYDLFKASLESKLTAVVDNYPTIPSIAKFYTFWNDDVISKKSSNNFFEIGTKVRYFVFDMTFICNSSEEVLKIAKTILERPTEPFIKTVIIDRVASIRETINKDFSNRKTDEVNLTKEEVLGMYA